SVPSSDGADGTGNDENAAEPPSSGGRQAVPATGADLSEERGAKGSGAVGEMSLGTAFLPYTALLGITLAVLLVPPVERALSGISVGLGFPAFTTGLGHTTPAETSELVVFTHAGTFLLAAAIITHLCYAAMGRLGKGAW